MPTPLYDALAAFAAAQPLRMHMPGHKGGPTPMAEWSALAPLDLTELPPTGDLFAGGGPIGQAEELWARAFGMDGCLFLTGGSTQGLHTALALTCAPGDAILADRGCHRSVYHAMGLLALEPVYLARPWLAGAGVAGPISPEAVGKSLREHPNIKTVCITSPTYYGVLSDIPAISAVCRRFGAKLVVDGAHGAHLPFLGDRALAAADVVVTSAHKTLPAPGQSALLLVNGMDLAQVRRTAAVFGSSSPSYPMMAALDCVRDWLEGEGGQAYARTARLTARLREQVPCLTPADAPLDPTRLTVCCPDGRALEQALQARNIWPEMADAGHVVFILTCADDQSSIDRLAQALEELSLTGTARPVLSIAPAPAPRRVLSVRQALFSPVERLPLARAEGRVAARAVAPYPPGVPVIAPGEQVEKKLLSYLNEIGYNIWDSVAVVAQ